MVWKDNKGKTAKAANIGRRLREWEDGSHNLSFTGSAVAVGYEGINAKYRYLPSEHGDQYVPTNERVHKHSNNYWKQPETVLTSVRTMHFVRNKKKPALLRAFTKVTNRRGGDDGRRRNQSHLRRSLG